MHQRKSPWKGPRRRGLEELWTAHDDFRHAQSYRPYRLLNADETQDRHVFSHAHKFRRRAEATMKACKFDGSKPIESLQFLRMFKTKRDKNDIADGAALIILPDYLAGAAETTSLNELELGKEGFGGISSYCHAVQFLLRRFAADRYIDRAVEDFESVRQKYDEDEKTYAQRLRAKARCFGAVYPDTDIITRFIRGLDPALKPLLSAERNAGLRSCRTFYDVVDRAAGLGDSQRQMEHKATRRSKTGNQKRHRPDRIHSVESGKSPVRSEIPSGSSSRRGDAVMLQQEPGENAGTTLHASYYLEPSSKTTITVYGTPQSSLREGDSVNAVYPAKSYQNDPRDIFFKCFARRRKAPLFPCKDRSEDGPHFGLLERDNYAKLTDRQRE